MKPAVSQPLLCDICDIFEADAMLMDGRAVCARCANSLAPVKNFTTTRGRFEWFLNEYHHNEALPLWWVLWKFVQIECRMRLP